MGTGFLLAMFAISVGAPEAEYTAAWEERTYDLSQLRPLDLFLVYWMGPSIAHTIMSFGFDDGRYLDFSIELRRTQNDQYSAVAGFFKTHELVFIGANERDLMTLRKVRNEQIQLYRLRTPPERARALLVEYIKQANDLAVNPRFYNTLTTKYHRDLRHDARGNIVYPLRLAYHSDRASA